MTRTFDRAIDALTEAQTPGPLADDRGGPVHARSSSSRRRPRPRSSRCWRAARTGRRRPRRRNIADAATAREASIQRYWSYFGAEDAPQRLQDPQQADLALLGLVNADEQTMGRPVIGLARLRHEVGEMWQADRRRLNPAGVGVQVVEWKPEP